VGAVLSAVFLLGGCAASVKGIRTLPVHAPRIESPAFRQEMGAVVGSAFLPGNRLTSLVDGDQIFPAMLQAIRSAKRTITFETFVYDQGEAPEAFTTALCERARAGVEVRVLFDGIGAISAGSALERLRQAGAQVAIHHPVLRHLTALNYRTHRKLLVVDGRLGFIGGVGIGDHWLGHSESPPHWHDTHYRVEGPVVVELQGAFLDNWLRHRGELLNGPGYFPSLPAVGNATASCFYSSPEHDARHVEIMFHLAIAAARSSLLIETPYFVPDSATIDALANAAKRGVNVKIILPGPYTDHLTLRRASRARWRKLLVAGVEIYEFQPTMTHAKLFVADGLFVSVGSANLDYRSLQINDEANLNVLDPAFAASQIRIFNCDLARSRRVRTDEHGKSAGLDEALDVLQSPIDTQL
jgi:cardiolipin synthase